MTQPLDRSGERVGDYQLVRLLGKGGFGEVYLAQDMREHINVAVKIFQTSLSDRESVKAFLNEARSFRLQHPHIVPLLDIGISQQDSPFLVMQYITGGTMRKRYPKGVKVPLETVVRHIIQIASALQYAHDRHTVHRDVKPENMLWQAEDTVLLSDFGLIAVAHTNDSINLSQHFGGTLPYMAPEQHAGKPRATSDQYALAVTAYEWLAGARPFQGTAAEILFQHVQIQPRSLVECVPGLALQVEQVIFKALSKAPEERFLRIQDFADASHAASQTAPGPRPPFFSTSPTIPPQPTPYPIARTYGQRSPDTQGSADQQNVLFPNVQRHDSLPPVVTPPSSPLPPMSTHSSVFFAAPASASGNQPAPLPAQQPAPLTPPPDSLPPVLSQPGWGQSIPDRPSRETRELVPGTPSMLSAPSPWQRDSSQFQTGSSHLPKRPETRRRKSLTQLLPAATVLVIIIIIGMLSYGYLLVNAANVSVSFETQMHTISQVFILKADPAVQAVNLSSAIIPAHTVSASGTTTQTGPTSGQVNCFFFSCQQGVDPQDVTNLVDQMLPNVEQSLSDELAGKIRAVHGTQIGPIAFDQPVTSSNPLVGQPGLTVTVTLTEQASVGYFLNRDETEAVNQSLLTTALHLGPGYQIIGSTIIIGRPKTQAIDANSGVSTIDIPAGAVARYQFTPAQLQAMSARLVGKSLTAAAAFLKNQPGIDPASIYIRFISGSSQTMPGDTQHITLLVSNQISLPPVPLTPVSGSTPTPG